MALITLNEVKVGLTADLDKGVIDEFTRGDYLFSNMLFDNIANPITGGSGWIVSYVKTKDEAKTQFRDINGKYESTFVKKETKQAEVKIYGGKFEIDRALRDQGGVENEVAFQMAQLVKGIKKGFSYQLINGAIATDGKQFDGLDALLKSSSTDVDANNFDLSTFEKIKENALEFTTKIDEFLSTLNEKPQVLLMNKTLLAKIKAVAKVVGLHTITEDGFGKSVDAYNGIPMVALLAYDDGNGAKETVAINGDTTCMYAVRFGADAFYVGTPSNGKVIEVIAPDFNQAAEQVAGIVEMRAVPILKNSKSCGVLRNIKVK